ncbi:hypothetical protein L6E12_11230 [Actinokineospora sp. PR83]|uniref:deaminase domain-containing protein n=1 Tax=Actinokineospora sp. PR83 TaxID=2884908 RepID=UPI0027DF1BA9|nr:deaminase domain-containing protein [Actinokineospora sp. PR83]MCG8916362.1 hypothetical protein [Actinokineospora sp. PR83]
MPTPTEVTLNRGPADIARDYDSEWKLLEHLAKGRSGQEKGWIRIYSERPVCESCQAVIADFEKKFPNVTVTYEDLGRGKKITR